MLPLTSEGMKVFVTVMKKLRRMEYFRKYTAIKTGIANTISADLENYYLDNLPKLPRIKHLDSTYFSPKDWSSMGDNGDITDEIMRKYLERHINLESFKIQIIRTSFTTQDILNILQGLVPLVQFRHLEFEFLNCGVGDMDLASSMYGISQLPQLKYLNLKIIQSLSISLEYIEKFVNQTSCLKNIEKFDLYFRKQNISQRDVPRIENMFSRFKDVQCSCSAQSLYVYKTQP